MVRPVRIELRTSRFVVPCSTTENALNSRKELNSEMTVGNDFLYNKHLEINQSHPSSRNVNHA